MRETLPSVGTATLRCKVPSVSCQRVNRTRSGDGFTRQGTNIVGEIPGIVVCFSQAGSIRGHRGAVEPSQEGAYQVLECGAILKGQRAGEISGLDLEPGYVP